MDSVIVDWIIDMAANNVPIDVMTAVMRADGYDDADIAAAYDAVSEYTSTEIISGLYYITLDRT